MSLKSRKQSSRSGRYSAQRGSTNIDRSASSAGASPRVGTSGDLIPARSLHEPPGTSRPRTVPNLLPNIGLLPSHHVRTSYKHTPRTPPTPWTARTSRTPQSSQYTSRATLHDDAVDIPSTPLEELMNTGGDSIAAKLENKTRSDKLSLQDEMDCFTMLYRGATRTSRPGTGNSKKGWLELMIAQAPRLQNTLTGEYEKEARHSIQRLPALEHVRSPTPSSLTPMPTVLASFPAQQKVVHTVAGEIPKLTSAENAVPSEVVQRSDRSCQVSLEYVSDLNATLKAACSSQSASSQSASRRSSVSGQGSPEFTGRPSNVEVKSQAECSEQEISEYPRPDSSPHRHRTSSATETVMHTESTATALTRVNTQVNLNGPAEHGVSAEQFRDFFTEHCGDIVYQKHGDKNISEESSEEVLCFPMKLAERCLQWNLSHPDAQHPRESNLYAVNEFFIKPATKEPEPDGQSYAEYLNLGKPLKTEFFMSHHWGEDFGELIQGVLRHAKITAPLRGKAWQNQVYWCCAFANNQHKVNLGANLEDSPFYQALSSVDCLGMILNINQSATALQRIWCIYEIYLTFKMDKGFMINTPQGPLFDDGGTSGSQSVWVLHVFRLLQHIDVSHASASCSEDKEKILEEIKSVGVPGKEAGADALNRYVRAALADQALPTLARQGDVKLIKKALELRADPNRCDMRGVRPLTYAAGNGMDKIVTVLRQHGANPRAAEHAGDVLNMWHHLADERAKALEAVQKLNKDLLDHVHGQALKKAALQHSVQMVNDAVMQLDKAHLRYKALEMLKHHVGLLRKLKSGLGIAQQHAGRLARCLVDEDTRNQEEAVRVVSMLGNLEGTDFIKPGDIPAIPVPASPELAKRTPTLGAILLSAAKCESSNVLYALLTGLARIPEAALTKRDRDDRSVLHLAAASGHTECVRILAERYYIPGFFAHQDRDRRTVIHHAAVKGSHQILRCVMELCDVSTEMLSAKDRKGLTPAHVAAEGTHHHFLRALVLHDMPAEAFAEMDNEGRNVVHVIAASRSHAAAEKCANTLEDCNIPKRALSARDKWHRTPAHIAAQTDSPHVLRWLKDQNAALHLPLGAPEVCRDAVALVPQEAKSGGWRLGKVAHVNPAKGTVKFVFDDSKVVAGSFSEHDPTTCKFAPTPFLIASKFGNKAALEVLQRPWRKVALHFGFNDQEWENEASDGSLPFGLVAASGKPEKIDDYIRENQVDVTEKDAHGRSALHRAARRGDARAVHSIWSWGCFEKNELRCVDDSGRHPGHHSAASGDTSCFRTILEVCNLSDADLALPDKYHQMPVHHATIADAVGIVEELEQRGVSLHVAMGPAVREKGTAVLVCRRPPHMSGTLKIDEQTGWQVGCIKDTFNGLLMVQYEDGVKETVHPERCIFAPTPFVLAHRLNCHKVRKLLWDRWQEWSFHLGVDQEALEKEAIGGALPLGTAAASGKSDVISRYTQEVGADQIGEELCRPDSSGRTAMHRAARGGCLETIKTVATILDHPDMQRCLVHQDIEGWNVLHHAVASKNQHCLCEVLHLAQSRGQSSLTELLEAQDTWCRSPLHLAVQADEADAVGILADAGDDLDRTMGSTQLQESSVVLTSQVDHGTTTWRLGKIWTRVGVQVTVRYETKDQQCRDATDTNSFIVGPSSLDLAEKLGCTKAAAIIRERQDTTKNKSPARLQKAIRKTMVMSTLAASMSSSRGGRMTFPSSRTGL